MLSRALATTTAFYKWAARRGGEGKKGKDRKRSGLSPLKMLRAPTLQFITKLVYRWKASLRKE